MLVYSITICIILVDIDIKLLLFLQVMESIVLPCLILLRKLIYADPDVRLSLAQQSSLLLSLFRGEDSVFYFNT